MKKQWTKVEESYLRDNYKTQSKRDVGLQLGRSARGVQRKCKKMGLQNTKEEISLLISNGMINFFKRTGRKWNRRPNDTNYNKMYNDTKYDKHIRKSKLLSKHGGKCILCEMNDIDVLQFDHIDNDGYKYNHVSIITQVETNPEKFQILCANCNTKKEAHRREFDRLEKLGIPPF